METVQIIVAVIGALLIAEAVWGLSLPQQVRKLVGWFMHSFGERQPILAFILLLAAAALWAVVVVNMRPTEWILLLLGVFLAWEAWQCWQPGRMRRLVEVCVLNRRVAVLRMIFAGELLLGAFLLWLAISGY